MFACLPYALEELTRVARQNHTKTPFTCTTPPSLASTAATSFTCMTPPSLASTAADMRPSPLFLLACTPYLQECTA